MTENKKDAASPILKSSLIDFSPDKSRSRRASMFKR